MRGADDVLGADVRLFPDERTVVGRDPGKRLGAETRDGAVLGLEILAPE